MDTFTYLGYFIHQQSYMKMKNFLEAGEAPTNQECHVFTSYLSHGMSRCHCQVTVTYQPYL